VRYSSVVTEEAIQNTTAAQQQKEQACTEAHRQQLQGLESKYWTGVYDVILGHQENFTKLIEKHQKEQLALATKISEEETNLFLTESTEIEELEQVRSDAERKDFLLVITSMEAHAKRHHAKILKELKAVHHEDILALKKEQKRYRQEVKKTVPNDLLYVYAKTKKEKERRKELKTKQREVQQKTTDANEHQGPDPPSWIPPPPSSNPPPPSSIPPPPSSSSTVTGMGPRSTSAVLNKTKKKKERSKMDSRTKSSTPRTGDIRHSESGRRSRNSKTDVAGTAQNGLSNSALSSSPREKKYNKKKTDSGQRIDGEEGPSSVSHLSMLAEQPYQKQDPEKGKTTDEFLQFIADPAADEEKRLRLKKKDKKAATLEAILQQPQSDEEGQNGVVLSPHNPPENI